MEHIVIIDRDNLKYDEMRCLQDHIANLINHNICKIQDDGRHVEVRSASDNSSETEMGMRQNNPGYEREMDLYHRLVLEHNEKHPESLLDFWCRS